MLQRRDDWSDRLDRVVDDYRRRTFYLGVTDCFIFPADAVRAMTGTDFMADARGRYRTEKSAVRKLIAALGTADPREIVSMRLGAPLDGPLYAQRGDVALLPADASLFPHALGVCLGRTVAAYRPEGLVEVPLAVAVEVWRV